MTRWLFDLGAARAFLTIVADNEGSVAVARRAGFVHEGTMRAHSVWQGERHDVLLLCGATARVVRLSQPLIGCTISAACSALLVVRGVSS